MITCAKTFPDFPFAHRQPAHKGHCALIHGHNWSFHFVFQAQKKDECDFVIDFGDLQWLKDWLKEWFDHTVVLNVDDPENMTFMNLSHLMKVKWVPSCSCEGLAEFVFKEVDTLLAAKTKCRVSLQSLTVHEDSKNSATFKRSATFNRTCHHLHS